MVLSSDDNARIDQISAQTIEVAEATSELSVSVDRLVRHQAKQIVQTRRIAMITAIGLLLDLILTVVGIFLIRDNDRISDRLDNQQRQLTIVQQRASTEALCPLYDLLLDSYDPNSLAAKQDPTLYEHTVRIVEIGASALGCEHVIRGKD